MRSRRSRCPVAFALDLLGDRWTLLVMRDVLMAGRRRFRELLAAEERIATNVLSERLRRLEAAGLLTRAPDPEDGRQVLYHPTPKGADLLPVLLALVQWSGRHDPRTGAPPALLAALERDPGRVQRRMRARVDADLPAFDLPDADEGGS